MGKAVRGFFTTYYNRKRLDMSLGGVIWTPPPIIYFGLSLTGPTKFGIANEPIGGGYARVGVVNDLVHFPMSSPDGTKTNGTDIVFPRPTASWGIIVCLFAADAMNNLLFMADTSEDKEPKPTDPDPP